MSSKELKNFALSVVNEAMRGIMTGDDPAFIQNAESPSLSSSSQGQKQTLTSSGYRLSVNRDKNKLFEPQTRNIVSMAPEATIIIRKREFSSLKDSNDLQWMDATEKMLLRATKALFAGKVEQIRLFESLTKFKNFFSEYQEYSLNLLSQVMFDLDSIMQSKEEEAERNSSGNFFSDLGSAIMSTPAAAKYESAHDNLIDLIRRNAFAQDSLYTTWIVDPSASTDYGTGPGTGAIELNMFTSFSTKCDLSSNPSGASINILDPYRIMYVTDDDIEIAIDEAMSGSSGIFNRLESGMYSKYDPNKNKILSGARNVLESLSKLKIDVGHIRERMRTFYLGKPIINPADSVNFYIRGNKTLEDYETMDYKSMPTSSIDGKHLDVDENILKAEKELYGSDAISFDAYKKIRSESDSSFGKIHVYGGIVTSTSESFNGGEWTLSIQCEDNMKWLQWTRFCKKPALANKKGILEDPLTPFEYKRNDDGSINYSEGQTLLSENKKLLATGFLSYDDGILSGQNASEENLMQGQFNGDGSLFGSKVIQHPNGFVYRWKTGILTATAGFQAHDPVGEGVRQEKTNQEHYGLTIAEQIFTNLDIANILSILVVGEPYNVQTFMENSLEAHTTTKGSAAELNPQDPITGVLDSVRNQNSFYGNFKPYRMITMNQESVQKTLQNQSIKTKVNSNIEKLQKKRKVINKRIAELKKVKQTQNSILIGSLETESKSIESAIKKQVELGLEAVADDNSGGLSLKLDLFGSASSDSSLFDKGYARALMMVGAQRRVEDVKLNRDRNLFIVSDQYDSTELKPFILNLNKSGWPLFSAGYTNAFDQINTAVSTLNMEFFCNTNGHLEFRPPQWNRVPYSVLKDAISSGMQKGSPIVPGFITSMFQNRIDQLYLEIHTLNIKIALIALLMGRYPDRNLIPNMPPLNSGPDSLDFFGIDVDKKILSLENTSSSITVFGSSDRNDNLTGNGLSLRATARENKGDVLFGNTNIILGDLDSLFQEANGVTVNLDDGKEAFGFPPARSAGHSTVENLNNIRNSFISQNGIDPANGLNIDKDSGFTAKDFTFTQAEKEGISIDNNGLLKKLKMAISARDKNVRVLQNNLKKKEELSQIEELFTKNTDEEQTGPFAGAIGSLQKVADGMGNAISAIRGDIFSGSIYDHLIQDDRRNLLGPGSGSRLIIRDHDIISMNFSETPPQYTRFDVTGTAPLGLANNLNNSTDSLYFWAGSADFDLWRQYGYRAGSESVPFISDSETQGRPYAILKLQLARANINRGTVTVAGNEFYQPGDTVYIPSKGLLYYVESVDHSFNQGSEFRTRLSLTYGHPPGSYLPSPLDVIGQQVSKNIVEQSIITYRSDTGDDAYRPLRPDCSMIFPSSSVGVEEIMSYSDNEVRFTNMMIDLMGSLIANKYVLIRAFVENSKNSMQISSAQRNIDYMREMLENPMGMTEGGIFGIGAKTKKLRLPNNIPVTPISSNKIIEQIVYLDRKDDVGKIGTLRCFDRRLTAALGGEDSEIKKEHAAGILPIGGPSQRAWLDLHVAMEDKNEIVEVGLLTVINNYKANREPGFFEDIFG